jgi:hypothetical protein
MCPDYDGIDLNMCCAFRCGNVLNVTVSECVQNGGSVPVNMCCASRSSHMVQSQVEMCPNKNGHVAPLEAPTSSQHKR